MATGGTRIVRYTGLFVTAACLVAIAYNLAYGLLVARALTPTIAFNCVVIGLLGALFFASIHVRALTLVQPLGFFAVAAIGVFQAPDGMYGASFFVMGMVLVFRLGYLERRRPLKLALLAAFYVTVVAVSYALNPGRSITTLVGPLIFIVLFLLFLYLAFEGRIAVYLKEPKPRLSLAERGLSQAEQVYTMALAKGRAIKEIAYDFEVSESTVRNTLARAYRKLDVDDKAGVAALAEKYEIVE